MTDLQEFPNIVADLVLEATDTAERMKRARQLMYFATSMVINLEGSEGAAEIAYRMADRMVEGFN
jgi:hypothetical protein